MQYLELNMPILFSKGQYQEKISRNRKNAVSQQTCELNEKKTVLRLFSTEIRSSDTRTISMTLQLSGQSESGEIKKCFDPRWFLVQLNQVNSVFCSKN